MKITFCWLVLSVSLLFSARGDLTIVYSSSMTPASKTGNDEAAEPARGGANMTIKIKSERARIDASPQLTTIFDGKTGEVINLLNDQKTVVRISSDKLKAVTDMLDKFSDKKAASEKPKLMSTGQKETVNGYETEQYTYDRPGFPGLPIRTRMVLSKETPADKPGASPSTHGTEITSTITSVSHDPINDSEFTVPGDFKEMKLPDIFNKQNPAPSVSPSP